MRSTIGAACVPRAAASMAPTTWKSGRAESVLAPAPNHPVGDKPLHDMAKKGIDDPVPERALRTARSCGSRALGLAVFARQTGALTSRPTTALGRLGSASRPVSFFSIAGPAIVGFVPLLTPMARSAPCRACTGLRSREITCWCTRLWARRARTRLFCRFLPSIHVSMPQPPLLSRPPPPTIHARVPSKIASRTGPFRGALSDW